MTDLLQQARDEYVREGGDPHYADLALGMYDRMAEAYASGDTSTFASEVVGSYAAGACTALGAGAAAPWCYQVGRWAGEKFGELVEAFGGRENPCIDNPAQCVATNELSILAGGYRMRLMRAYNEAIAAVAEELDPQPGGWAHMQTVIDQAKELMPPPEWPWPGQVTATLDQVPSIAQRIDKKYTAEAFAVAANSLEALARAHEIRTRTRFVFKTGSMLLNDYAAANEAVEAGDYDRALELVRGDPEYAAAIARGRRATAVLNAALLLAGAALVGAVWYRRRRR